MNILITGGAGYVGLHLVNYLTKKKKNINIFIIDNFSNSSKEVTKFLKKKNQKKLQFENIDIRNKKKLKIFFIKHKIDIVIHLAAKIDAELSFKDRKEYKSTNLDATKQLVELSIKNDVKKFIFASSAAVYGEVSRDYCSENKRKKPINPYGMYKLEAENFLKKKKKFIDIVVLRFFNIAGINKIFYPFIRKKKSVLFLIVNAFLKKKLIFYINRSNNYTKDNSTIRDYIHVEDISKIIWKTIFIEKNLFIINCGRGLRVSVVKLIKYFENLTEKKIKILYKNSRRGDPTLIVSNNKQFNKYLKNFNFKSLKLIILDYVNLYLYFKKKL